MVRFTLVVLAFIPTACVGARRARIAAEENALNTDTVSLETGDLSTDIDSSEWFRRRRTTTTTPSIPGYAGVDSPTRRDCGSEYTLGGLGHETLPDLLTHAHEWCRSDIVPEHLRVPESLRGLYWMKDMPFSDIAFCGSLGEYDPETFTIRIPVWMGFVVGKEPDEEIPALLVHELSTGSPLIYSLVFTNSSMSEARIIPSNGLFNAISRHAMKELPETKDGTLKSERPGDIFDRPSFFFGFFRTDYEAVKVMYDDGSLNEEAVTAMRAKEMNNNVTYMRLAPSC